MSMVEFKNASKKFGTNLVLHPINLSIDPGEVAVVVGPSGSGKSTMLRCINVLEKISDGDLLVDNISVLSSSHDVRRIRLEAGMVFQQFNLFPQLTAIQNVMFGPIRARGHSKIEAREIAAALLEKVGARGANELLSIPTFGRTAAARGHRPGTGRSTQTDPLR